VTISLVPIPAALADTVGTTSALEGATARDSYIRKRRAKFKARNNEL
jgi:hypothetical protein